MREKIRKILSNFDCGLISEDEAIDLIIKLFSGTVIIGGMHECKNDKSHQTTWGEGYVYCYECNESFDD